MINGDGYGWKGVLNCVIIIRLLTARFSVRGKIVYIPSFHHVIINFNGGCEMNLKKLWMKLNRCKLTIVGVV